MSNPFVYGKQVSGYQFYDRHEVGEELAGYLRDGSTNVVLYAPRRYGKTSLVSRVLTQLKMEGMDCLLFDISRVGTVEKFCEAYTSALYAVYGGLPEIGNRISHFLTRLRPTISFSPDGVEIKFDRGAPLSEASLVDVLDLPEKLAAEAKRPIVIAFDEFQDIGVFSTEIPIEAVMRGAIQTQHHARYVFFGSKTHLMRRMFGAASRPFYKSAFTMRLDKPPRAESFEFVSSRFGNEGVEVPEAAVNRILDISENIPYYVQALSGLVFTAVARRRDTRATVQDVDDAAEHFVSMNDDLYSEMLRNLPPSQRALIEALAKEPAGRFEEAYRTRHDLGGLSTVHSALNGLVNRGLVETTARGSSIGDPLFARYLREQKTFFVPPIDKNTPSVI